MERADWNNTEIVKGDVVATVAALKAQQGQDIVLYGHGGVGQALLEDGLLDELKLWLHPVVVGRGTLLFRPGEHADLTLAGADTTSTGVGILT
jgi:dihydrofolate reductase